MATLKITVHLWTDEVPQGADCWDYGVVHVPVKANAKSGLEIAGNPGVPFNRPEDLPLAIAKALRQAGIVTAEVKR